MPGRALIPAAFLLVGLPWTCATLVSQASSPDASVPKAAYVGSAACRRRHAPVYERWSKTRMANVGTANNADLIKPARSLCLTCHGPASANGPRGATLEEHTHHRAGSAGSECVAGHMPRIEQTIADVNVRSHTFRFISPTLTEPFKIPNPCTSCHTDRSVEWARETLRHWPGVSPWRMN